MALSFTATRADTMWPTVIFATSRTVRVRGRIIIEIVSIKTSNGERAKGAPEGDKWAVIITGTIFTWVASRVDQKINPKVAAIQIVEVKGKVKGAIPIKFKTIKDTKTLRNQLVLSLIDTLLIILESFLIIGLNMPLEGSKRTSIGKIHITEFPWSTLEKISAIILDWVRQPRLVFGIKEKKRLLL